MVRMWTPHLGEQDAIMLPQGVARNQAFTYNRNCSACLHAGARNGSIYQQPLSNCFLSKMKTVLSIIQIVLSCRNLGRQQLPLETATVKYFFFSSEGGTFFFLLQETWCSSVFLDLRNEIPPSCVMPAHVLMLLHCLECHVQHLCQSNCMHI